MAKDNPLHHSEIHLYYAYICHGGQTYRILTTNFKKLIAGNRTSDFLGFFGLGSGEFWTPRIEALRIMVTPIEVDNTSLDVLMWKDHPRFIGFIDAQPDHKPIVILEGGDVSLYELPINWEVYTQLGTKELARDTLRTFRRAHIAYETPEQNQARVDDIMRMSQML